MIIISRLIYTILILDWSRLWAGSHVLYYVFVIENKRIYQFMTPVAFGEDHPKIISGNVHVYLWDLSWKPVECLKTCDESRQWRRSKMRKRENFLGEQMVYGR